MAYIGKDVKKRMKRLGLSIGMVAEKAFLDEKTVKEIVKNKIALEELDDFDLNLLCDALHCESEFFTDENVKRRGLLNSSTSKDTAKSRKVKAKLQNFLNDFSFMSGL